MRALVRIAVGLLVVFILCTFWYCLRPDIYIISVEKIIDFEMRDNWVLQYAIDGDAEQAVFASSEACEKYIEYLKDQGVMYD